MTIVQAGPHAAEAFAALHAEGFTPAWSASAFHGMLLDLGVYGLIAMEGPAPRGMVVASALGPQAEILTIAVARAARRRGVGRALMRAAEDQAQAKGAAAMLLDVAADNTSARALYAGLGYEQIAIRKGYYVNGPGAPRDALVLRKLIAR